MPYTRDPDFYQEALAQTRQWQREGRERHRRAMEELHAERQRGRYEDLQQDWGKSPWTLGSRPSCKRQPWWGQPIEGAPQPSEADRAWSALARRHPGRVVYRGYRPERREPWTPLPENWFSFQRVLAGRDKRQATTREASVGFQKTHPADPPTGMKFGQLFKGSVKNVGYGLSRTHRGAGR